jgi:hypothetical protein
MFTHFKEEQTPLRTLTGAALTRPSRIGHNLSTGNPNLASASLFAGFDRCARMASLIPRTRMGTESLNENCRSSGGQSGRNLLFHYSLCANNAVALCDSGEGLDNSSSNRHSHPSQITLNPFN